MCTATAKMVARFLRKDIFKRWGYWVTSCRIKNLSLCPLYYVNSVTNVIPKLTTAYHPQTNMTERVNHTLKCMWKSYVEDNHGKWDQYLPELRFAIN